MLIPSDRYILENVDEKLVFRDVKIVNNEFSKAYAIVVLIVTAIGFIGAYLYLLDSLFVTSVIGYLLAVGYSYKTFFAKGSLDKPYLVWDRKRSVITILERIEIPYSRARLIKVDLFYMYSDGESAELICVIELLSDNNVSLFKERFDGEKTN